MAGRVHDCPVWSWFKQLIRAHRKRRARRRRLRSPEILARRVRLEESRRFREARRLLAEQGPPVAPWLKYPRAPHAFSIAWRMGEGEDYLRYSFYPFWNKLSEAEQDKYLIENDAPKDWWELVRLRRGLPVERAIAPQRRAVHHRL